MTLTEFFEKVIFLKKLADDKNMQNYPVCKVLNCYLNSTIPTKNPFITMGFEDEKFGVEPEKSVDQDLHHMEI